MIRLVVQKSLRLPRATTERPHQLVTVDGDALVVASGRSVTVYDRQLTEIETILCSDAITCVRRSCGRLFVAMADRVCEIDRSGSEWTLVSTLWADPSDVFAIEAATLWFAGAGPMVCAFDIEQQIHLARIPLGDGWSGGSFAFWPCRDGVVVSAPMDRKAAWIASARAPTLAEIPCNGHVIGAGERSLLSVGEGVDVQELPSGALMTSMSVGALPQFAATIGDDVFLFGQGGVHRVAAAGVESVAYPERADRSVVHGAAFGNDVVLVLGDGELAVAGIRRT